jgi:N-acyl-D-aspartate/D-glutamate deacylase
MGDPPRYDRTPDESIGAIAARRGTSAAEVAYDLLTAGDDIVTLYVPVTNFVERDMRAVRAMLEHPFTVPGLGDAGAHCTMICDGSFPTYMLSHWAFAAPAADRFPIEWVVKRQCADTATLVGLHDRGVLAPGRRADINLIDPDQLAIGAPEMRYDLPAGGKRLVQRARGYRTTFVAGTPVMIDGDATGAQPGNLVRGARAAHGAPTARGANAAPSARA